MKESRLFRILYYILENGRTSAPVLAKQFEVSVRTIYRDIDVISSAGIPIYVTPGRNGGVQIHKNYILNRAMLTDKEKQEILSALQSTSLVNALPGNATLTKLSALFQQPSDNWFEVDFSRWGIKSQDDTSFSLLKKAILSHHAVKIVYVNTNGQKTERTVYPLKMVFKARQWYLKAFCVNKNDFRLFKMSRMLKLHLLSETFVPMEYPNPIDDLQKTYPKTVLLFPKEMAYRVYDEFEATEIKEIENGSLLVSVEMPQDNWLIGYLLSFGSTVEILEPSWLRKALAIEAEKIYNKNIS
ncbi:YafY family protein [Massilicoli timonensis]|uniref:YafY family transcriptional regulator n=1 Tax=Massilicoli timonensis TaxID=2015901 RepID=A0ABT1SI11_9FIRM|nr:YafY family protein [Massilicoli timonensis]MCQ5120750.1 YafY family transcriptional regulator [Massilicoli timonensis]